MNIVDVQAYIQEEITEIDAEARQNHMSTAAVQLQQLVEEYGDQMTPVQKAWAQEFTPLVGAKIQF